MMTPPTRKTETRMTLLPSAHPDPKGGGCWSDRSRTVLGRAAPALRLLLA